jgi:hypothetical protein
MPASIKRTKEHQDIPDSFVSLCAFVVNNDASHHSGFAPEAFATAAQVSICARAAKAHRTR